MNKIISNDGNENVFTPRPNVSDSPYTVARNLVDSIEEVATNLFKALMADVDQLLTQERQNVYKEIIAECQERIGGGPIPRLMGFTSRLLELMDQVGADDDNALSIEEAKALNEKLVVLLKLGAGKGKTNGGNLDRGVNGLIRFLEVNDEELREFLKTANNGNQENGFKSPIAGKIRQLRENMKDLNRSITDGDSVRKVLFSSPQPSSNGGASGPQVRITELESQNESLKESVEKLKTEKVELQSSKDSELIAKQKEVDTLKEKKTPSIYDRLWGNFGCRGRLSIFVTAAFFVGLGYWFRGPGNSKSVIVSTLDGKPSSE